MSFATAFDTVAALVQALSALNQLAKTSPLFSLSAFAYFLPAVLLLSLLGR